MLPLAEHCRTKSLPAYMPAHRMLPDATPLRLTSEHAQHFSQLLDILHACELSAITAFEQLSVHAEIEPRIALQFRGICRDECRHDLLLSQLKKQLPACETDRHLERKARRFLLRMQSRDPYRHALRIGFLDAAVCRILSMLLQPRLPLREDIACRFTLTHIWRDESRHAAITTRFAQPFFDLPTLRNEFLLTRHNLVDVLSMRASAFVGLGVDFVRLSDALLTIPHQLRLSETEEITP